jgi:LysR family glycine cleavage system transcriptional activator
VTPSVQRYSGKIAAFKEWLVREARESKPMTPG